MVNSKRWLIEEILKELGYQVKDTITWVKVTEQLRLYKGWGKYLLHGKEECILAKKGNVDDISAYH